MAAGSSVDGLPVYGVLSVWRRASYAYADCCGRSCSRYWKHHQHSENSDKLRRYRVGVKNLERKAVRIWGGWPVSKSSPRSRFCGFFGVSSIAIAVVLRLRL